MRKNRFNLPVRILVYLFTILLALCAIVFYIWKVATGSEYFRVKEVVVRQLGSGENVQPVSDALTKQRSSQIAYLIGKNIFALNLGAEARYLLDHYPGYRAIRIVRLLPSRLVVDFIRRKPVALIRLYKYFALDEEGVIFTVSGEVQESMLPVISGLETRIFGPKPGKKYTTKEITLALGILKEIKRSAVLRNYLIKKVDLSQAANASFFILSPLSQEKSPEYIEVKLGSEDIRNKINFLASLFEQEKQNLTTIKYVDLRFKEPTIKFKDVKAKPKK